MMLPISVSTDDKVSHANKEYNLEWVKGKTLFHTMHILVIQTGKHCPTAGIENEQCSGCSRRLALESESSRG